jgi:hypothetical protein
VVRDEDTAASAFRGVLPAWAQVVPTVVASTHLELVLMLREGIRVAPRLRAKVRAKAGMRVGTGSTHERPAQLPRQLELMGGSKMP